jgi:hypothetical protein
MTEKEKLEFLVATNGTCKGRKFRCHDCPLTDKCHSTITDEEILGFAKERLAELSKQTSVDSFVEGYKAHQQKLKNLGYTDDSRFSEPLTFFVQQMERKLRENNFKGTWTTESLHDLFRLMIVETHELSDEIHCTSPRDFAWAERVALEAADTANFCMMIADLARSMVASDFHRDDEVMADGKKWRVDYVTSSCLGLSSADGSHKELSKEVCTKVDHTFDGIVTP